MTNRSRQPLVSVIVPAYCAAAHIERTLSSAAAQSYRNIEIIVVDDGSTDDTLAIAERFAEHDSRVKVFRQDNAGVSTARNYAIKMAAGEYVAPLDADDIWDKTNLEKQVAALETADGETAVSYAWSRHILGDDSLRGSGHAYMIDGDVYGTLLCHYFLGNASCTVIRRSALDTVGYYTTALKDGGADACEDWELYLRLAGRYKFKVVPEFLIGYRRTACTRSQAYEVMAQAHSMILAIAETHGRVPSFVSALSRSSLYIHLADRCAEFGTRAETLQWLTMAFQNDCITPLLRLDFYRLMIGSLLQENQSRVVRPGEPLWRHAAWQSMASLPRLAMGSLLHGVLRLVVQKPMLKVSTETAHVLESAGKST